MADSPFAASEVQRQRDGFLQRQLQQQQDPLLEADSAGAQHKARPPCPHELHRRFEEMKAEEHDWKDDMRMRNWQRREEIEEDRREREAFAAAGKGYGKGFVAEAEKEEEEDEEEEQEEERQHRWYPEWEEENGVKKEEKKEEERQHPWYPQWEER